VAGLRPGLGRGGITHSLVGPKLIGLCMGLSADMRVLRCGGAGFMASGCGAGAILAGEPAEVGVLPAEYICGDAMAVIGCPGR
jgi:hypothetical protein